MPTFLIILIASIAPLSWGTTFFVTTEYMPLNSPYWIGFWRAMPVALLWLLMQRHWPRKEWWGKLLVVSACNVGVFFPALFATAYLLPGGFGTMLVACQPIVLAFMIWIWLKRRPSLKTCIAIGIGVGGIVLIIAAPEAAHGMSVLGIGTALIALISFAAGTILLEKWGVMDGNLSAYTAWQLFLGALMVLPLALLVEGACPDFFIERSGIAYAPLYGLLFMGLINTGLAYYIWFWALERLSLITVSMLSLLGPLSAYFLDVYMLDTGLSLLEILGIVLVLSGVAYQGAIGNKAVAVTHEADEQRLEDADV